MDKRPCFECEYAENGKMSNSKKCGNCWKWGKWFREYWRALRKKYCPDARKEAEQEQENAADNGADHENAADNDAKCGK